MPFAPALADGKTNWMWVDQLASPDIITLTRDFCREGLILFMVYVLIAVAFWVSSMYARHSVC